MESIPIGRCDMQITKLHRYVSRSGPNVAALLAANALEAAENEGWPILPPMVRPSQIRGFHCFGRIRREDARLHV